MKELNFLDIFQKDDGVWWVGARSNSSLSCADFYKIWAPFVPL